MTQVEHGSLEPGGQLVLTLKAAEQGATKAAVDRSAAAGTRKLTGVWLGEEGQRSGEEA